MKSFLFAVALVGATLMTTSNAEAGIFGRRCNTGCRVRVVRTCQPVQVCHPVQVCQPAYQAQPVRTALRSTGRAVSRVLHKVLPPYKSACSGNSCVVQEGVVVQESVVQSEQNYPSPTEVTEPVPAEPTPPVPNVLPAAPVETP